MKPPPWPGACEERVELTPVWPLRLPGVGLDGLWRRRGALMRERLLHHGDDAVVVRLAQPASDRIVIGARSDSPEAAAWGVARVRAATGVDDDLREFHAEFRDDPLIGASVRKVPGLRPRRTPAPFEAFAWAVTEQLIEFRRAVEIQKQLIRRFGRRCALTGLRDAPSAQALACASPAEIEACGLTAGRAAALRRAAREVATGRVDLETTDPAAQEAGWTRLQAIPGIGAWTIEVTATAGQGRFDMLPAGDLAYVILVARLQGRADRAEVDEVREYFARFGRWKALAGLHALRSSGVAHLGPAQGLAV